MLSIPLFVVFTLVAFSVGVKNVAREGVRTLFSNGLASGVTVIKTISRHNPTADRRRFASLAGRDWPGFMLMHLAVRGEASEYERVYRLLQDASPPRGR